MGIFSGILKAVADTVKVPFSVLEDVSDSIEGTGSGSKTIKNISDVADDVGEVVGGAVKALDGLI